MQGSRASFESISWDERTPNDQVKLICFEIQSLLLSSEYALYATELHEIAAVTPSKLSFKSALFSHDSSHSASHRCSSGQCETFCLQLPEKSNQQASSVRFLTNQARLSIACLVLASSFEGYQMAAFKSQLGLKDHLCPTPTIVCFSQASCQSCGLPICSTCLHLCCTCFESRSTRGFSCDQRQLQSLAWGNLLLILQQLWGFLAFPTVSLVQAMTRIGQRPSITRASGNHFSSFAEAWLHTLTWRLAQGQSKFRSHFRPCCICALPHSGNSGVP